MASILSVRQLITIIRQNYLKVRNILTKHTDHFTNKYTTLFLNTISPNTNTVHVLMKFKQLKAQYQPPGITNSKDKKCVFY